jgi:hypothetical protein
VSLARTQTRPTHIQQQRRHLPQGQTPYISNFLGSPFHACAAAIPSLSAAPAPIARITTRPRPTMSPPPAVTLTTPPSPARARSVSQPVRDGVDFDPSSLLKPRTGFSRSQSSSSILRAVAPNPGPDAPPVAAGKAVIKGRARSSSLVTVTEVGGDELETVVDRLGVGTNENADWVNAPGESAHGHRR